MNRDATLLELLANEGRDLFVLDRHDVWCHLDDVTSVPRSRYRLANSTPIAPDPITSSDFGSSFGTSASK